MTQRHTPARRDAARHILALAAFAVAASGVMPRGIIAQAPGGPVTPSTTDTARLRPVVITATRVPFAQTAPTSSTTVITGQELQARGILSVADALRDVAGASPVQTGSMGGLTSLFVRGGESDYAKVLVDGVPLNQPGGTFYFQNLTTADIDRIEIVQGPTSVLYGSDAVTGVIQIFTKRGAGPPEASLDLRGGNYKSFDGTASLAGSAGSVRYSVGGARQTTDGILPFNNQFTNGELGARLEVGRASGSLAAFTARYHTADYHFPTVGDGTPVDSNQHRRDEGTTLAFEGSHVFASGLAGHINLTANNEDAADINPQDSPADTTGTYVSFDRDVFRRLGADAHVDARAGREAVFTLGGSVEGQTDRSRSFDVFNFGGVDTSVSEPVAYFRRVEAGYAQLLANIGNTGSLTLGGRLDHNTAFGTFGTYRVGLGVEVSPGFRLHGALGTAFKEPTIAQNFSTALFETGNPSLRPERSFGWEAGFTENPPGSVVTLAATYFDQQFRNIIDYTFASFPVPGHPGDSTNYINIAGATASGVEGSLVIGPINGSTLDLAYTSLDTRVTQNGVDTSGYSQYRVGQRLIRRPSHQFSGTLSQALSARGAISGTVRFVGTRDDINFNALTGSTARVLLPGYTTLDIAFSYRLTGIAPAGGGLSFVARATNLLDRDYQEVYSYDAPGRTVLVGFRLATGGK